MAANVFYSVSPFGTGDIKTGSPTISISGGVATLSVAQTGNIGQGCHIVYNDNNLDVYISQINSPTSFNVVNRYGGTPADCSGLAVDVIRHEYASLSDAEAGAVDAYHINNTSLVAADVVLNIPCYYDHDDDTVDSTSCTINGITTDATRYINIYAPTGGTQSINSQKHSGKISTSKYRLHVTSDGDATQALIITSMFKVVVTGLQITMQSAASANHQSVRIFTPDTNAVFIFDSCIIRGVYSGTADYSSVINCWDTDLMSLTIRNSLIYGARTTNTGYGVGATYGNATVTIQNCTISNCTTALYRPNGTWTVTNCAIFNNGDDINGTITITYCAIDDSDSFTGKVDISPGATETDDWNAAFTDYANGDFSLVGNSPLLMAGIGPTADANVPTTDIIGNTRAGATTSIGAFHKALTDVYYSCSPFGTGDLKTAYADSFTGSDDTDLEVHDSNWTGVDATWVVTGLEIVSNAIQLDFGWANCAAYYDASSSDESQIVFKAAGDSATGRAVAVRMGAGTRGYSAILLAVSGGNYTECYVRKNGNWMAAPFTGSWSTSSDHTIKIKASGTTTVTLEVWVDGVSLGTKTDSSSPIASGHPGFYVAGTGTISHSVMDDWTDCQNTCSISSGVMTLSTPQTGNIGQGDKITYDTSKVVYIKTVTDSTHFVVVDKYGLTPPDIAAGTTVNSIAHVWASLSAAEAGADDSGYLNSVDLTACNVVLNLACYYDHDDQTADTTAVTVDGYTADATRYINIFTPTGDTQSINRQRHSGVWSGSRYRIETTSNGLTISDNYTRVIGIQVQITRTSSLAYGIQFTGGNYGRAVGCIIKGVLSGTASAYGIHIVNDSDDSCYLFSNVILDFVNGTNACRGINYGDASATDALIYNNTVVNCYSGVYFSTSATAIYVINNLCFGCTDAFRGASTNASYNISDTETFGANSATTAQDVSALFTNYAGGDFSIKDTNSDLYDAGIVQTGVLVDILGNSRGIVGAACDIGAFEYVGGGATTRNLIATISAASTTPDVATTSARALLANIISASTTPDALSSLRRSILVSIGASSSTPDLSHSLSRNLVVTIAGSSLTSDIAAILVRSIVANISAVSSTPDIAATITGLISLIASIAAGSTTSDVSATLARSLLTSIVSSSTTPEATASLSRALVVAVGAGSITPDVGATILRSLIGSIQGSSTTPDATSSLLRELVATIAASSNTADASVEIAGIISILASIQATSSTGDAGATLVRALSSSVSAVSVTPEVAGSVLRTIIATIVGSSITPSIEGFAGLTLAASIVGASTTPDIEATVVRSLVASMEAVGVTPSASATTIRAIQAVVRGTSTTPDDITVALNSLGRLFNLTLESSSAKRTMETETPIRKIEST
jgi:hypothetical protein